MHDNLVFYRVDVPMYRAIGAKNGAPMYRSALNYVSDDILCIDILQSQTEQCHTLTVVTK